MSLVGSLVLVTLAGCGRSFLQYAERETWRREAEVACLQSGTVKQGAGVIRIEPIGGPGICGADFPLKVASLGESAALGFAGEAVRPPGAIPGASQPAQQPRWPTAEPRYAPRYTPPREPGAPLSISPPGIEAHAVHPQRGYPQGSPQYNPGPPPDDEDDEPAPPPRGRATPPPAYSPPPVRPAPLLGPQRNAGAFTPVDVKPAATLACPIVSALEQWLVNAVQPAAQKWFGRPVVEIRQISAYSCRGMNGQAGARISEHAFGNALDIAAFVLADGTRVTVKDGWRGRPEEQGFLRDVQAAACDQFTTVLAPGSNAFHYDHIHVDLMRRGSGRRICQPGAVDGDLVAARARGNPVYAAKPAVEPAPMRRYDPPFDARNDPFAWRGDARRGDPDTTGSVARGRAVRNPVAEDNDWVEDPGPRPKIDWSHDRTSIRY